MTEERQAQHRAEHDQAGQAGAEAERALQLGLLGLLLLVLTGLVQLLKGFKADRLNGRAERGRAGLVGLVGNQRVLAGQADAGPHDPGSGQQGAFDLAHAPGAVHAANPDDGCCWLVLHTGFGCHGVSLSPPIHPAPERQGQGPLFDPTWGL